MKTRKLLAMLLSLAMVFGLMVPAAMAEESSENVAKVAEVEYATLAKAIAAAGVGDTIVLLDDVNEIVTLSGNVILDLNGKAMTGSIELTAVAATLTAPEGLDVTTGVAVGRVPYYVTYSDGMYALAPMYTISIDLNGGSYIQGISDYQMYTKDVLAEIQLTNGTEKITREGYTFKGWYDAAVGGNEITTATVFTEDTTIFAQWTADIGEVTYVAKVGDTPYATLADAVAAAEAGGTVTLLGDASGAGIVINKNITIDFGGNTYTFTSGVGSTDTESNGFQILKDNTVTLKNGTLNIASGSADKFYTVIQNYANLTVTDMTLDATNADKWSKVETDQDSYALSINSGNVVINGATNIIANNDGNLAYAFDACQKNGYATPIVTVNTTGSINGKVEVTGGNLTVNGGTFHARQVGGVYTDTDVFVVSSGTLTINDAVVNGGDVEDTTAVWAHTNGKAVINGGTYTLSGKNVTSGHNDMIYAGKTNNGSGAEIEINGGVFSATNVTNPGANAANVWLLNEKDGQGTMTVKGGSFEGFNPICVYTEPAQPTSFVPVGYYVEENGGIYTVCDAEEFVGEVTLEGNIFVGDGGFVVDTETIVNLNGKTISAPSDTVGDGVFHVIAGGDLTINGEGTINGIGNNTYSMAIWADGGKVVINGGTYTNVGAGADPHYDLIYAKNGGSVEINGGTFTCQTPFWTLNKNDKTNGIITVKGGTFTGYNPSVSNTENPTANFVAEGYCAEQNGDDYVVKTKMATVNYESNGGSAVASETVDATVENCHFTKPADPTRTGYTFAGWFCESELTNSYDFETTSPAPGDEMTLYAKWNVKSSGGSSSGSSSSSNTTTTTEKNPDGSTTTTTTNKTTGTVTETTKNPDGTTGVTKTDADGNVTEVSANVPAAAAKAAEKADEPVTLPVEVEAADSSAEATEIKVNVPSTGATVEIPVENVTPGTVVVIVNADGTESIVPLTTLTEDGVVVTLEDDATIKVIDNSKDFTDVPDDYALADSIDFVSARGLFEGNTETTFNPHANTTIAQTMTVLARLSGEDFYGAGATTKGAEWATEKGLSDGTDVSKAITREQMVVMMWKLAGMPESDQALTASDVNDISADALTAMQWAVEMGILKGNLDGTINPNGNASRAHVAAFTERYVNALAN